MDTPSEENKNLQNEETQDAAANAETPVQSPKLSEAAPEPQMQYASVLTRFAALLIDYFLTIPFLIPFFIFFGRSPEESGGLGLFLVLLGYLGAFIFSVWNQMIRMGKTGQSLGRKYLGIAVLNELGEPIGIGPAIGRELVGRWISGLVCYLGYLWAFWDKKRQMWHDKMVTSYVYYVDDNYVPTRKL